MHRGRTGRSGSFYRRPNDFVERCFGNAVFFSEVELFALLLPFVHCGILFEDVHLCRNRLKCGRIYSIAETPPERFGSCIILTHRRQSKNEFDCPQYTGCGIHGVIDEMPFDESACNVDQASMSIDMIGAVLCVIFKNKNDAFFPDPAVAQIIDKKTDCEVVIGNFCDRRRAS